MSIYYLQTQHRVCWPMPSLLHCFLVFRTLHLTLTFRWRRSSTIVMLRIFIDPLTFFPAIAFARWMFFVLYIIYSIKYFLHDLFIRSNTGEDIAPSDALFTSHFNRTVSSSCDHRMTHNSILTLQPQTIQPKQILVFYELGLFNIECIMARETRPASPPAILCVSIFAEISYKTRNIAYLMFALVIRLCSKGSSRPTNLALMCSRVWAK